jgi:hypothetical protein
LIREVAENDLSQREVREMANRKGAGDEPFKALEEVKQASEAAEEARGFVLSQMRFGDETGAGIKQAERATGKDRNEIIKDAVQYYLRNEGYLE